MSHYTYLSEGIIGPKTVKPITASSINKNKKENKQGFFSWLFGSSDKVKPVTFNKETYAEEYYRRYGIIYNGSEFSSCVNSLI